MRDINRIRPFCTRLADLWTTCFPDLRFWQVLNVVAKNMESDYFAHDPFYAEEADWDKAIKKTWENYFEKNAESL